jgi:PKD repeat protein
MKRLDSNHLKSFILLTLVLSLFTARIPVNPVKASPETLIWIDPPVVSGLLAGDTFEIAIWINEAYNVYAWELEVSFTPHFEVIKATDALEGDFLMLGGPTSFSFSIDNTHGTVKLGDTLLGDVPGVDGDGILAFIAFEVVGGGESPLQLQNTILLDPQDTQLPHITQDSHFIGKAPYAKFTYSPNPAVDGYSPAVNQTITFNATQSYDPEGQGIASYSWTFGDGTAITTTQPIITHSYSQPAMYITTLTVTDLEGYNASYTDLITVVIRDIAITKIEVTPSGTVKAGTPITINVTAKNLGTARENFTVTAYYDNQPIGTQPLTLDPSPPRDTKTIQFTWNTAGLPLGQYTIKATAQTHPGDNNQTNNELIWGTINLAEISLLSYSVDVYGVTFYIQIETPSDISEFAFDYSQKQITFTVSGLEGTTGYCNVTIPQNLLNATPGAWKVTLNGVPKPYTLTRNNTHSSIHFNYTFASSYQVAITGTWVNMPPQANFTASKTTITPGETITFDATNGYDPDPNGKITQYLWDFGDDTPLVTETDPITEHTYQQEGTYTVKLTITDKDGLKNETSLEVGVFGKFEIAITDIIVSPTQVRIGELTYINVTITREPLPKPIEETSKSINLKINIFGNNSLLVSTRTIAPQVGLDKIVSLKWNTSEAAAGTYSIKAKIIVTEIGAISADEYPFKETDLSDNELVFGEVLVEKLNSILSIVVSPTSFTVGERAKISGFLSPPRVDSEIIIQIKTGDKGWTSIATTTTTAGGFYVYTWTPETAGTYQLRAGWNGDDITYANVSGAVTVTVEQMLSAITIDVDRTTTTLGSSVVISGKLTPQRQGITLTINVRKLGGTWSLLQTVTTDAEGNYSYEWTPKEPGTYEVQVIWEGDVNTRGSESEIKTVKVNAPTPLEIYTYAAVGAIAIIGAGFAVYFLKKRKT